MPSETLKKPLMKNNRGLKKGEMLTAKRINLYKITMLSKTILIKQLLNKNRY